MSAKNCNITININKINMKDCNMKMNMSNKVLDSEDNEGLPIFVVTGDGVIRSINPTTMGTDARITVVDGVAESMWIVSNGISPGIVKVNLQGTDLYLTFPDDGGRYVGLKPLDGLDNNKQFFNITQEGNGSFRLSRDGVVMSTENEVVSAGSFIVVPKGCEESFPATFSL